MSTPKVSVVIPCCNVEKYLRQCMDSVVNQTLRDIEIICINDGSQDSTLSILKEYAQRDSRVQIIDKPNTGYGHSMNLGIERASGEYLGIVESDDFAEPHMFETLYTQAKANQADVVKAGFFQYTTKENRDVPFSLPAKLVARKVFCPTKDLETPLKKVGLFRITPSIWSAVYRLDFIRENHIRFLESPGASYQDVGFAFKSWSCAERVMLLKEHLLHYRIDNAASSVRNPGKVYCICDEYAELNRFLEQCPEKRAEALPLLLRVKYENYLWNYERLADAYRMDFLHRFHDEFQAHLEAGELQRAYFEWYPWNNLQKILIDPDRYHMICQKAIRGEAKPDFYDAYPEQRPFRFKFVYYILENLAGGFWFLRGQGLAYTKELLFIKLKNKVHNRK